MKAKSPLLVLVSIFFSIAVVSAQQQISLTGGQFQRGSYDPIVSGTTGAFQFTSANSDLNGTLAGSSSSGVYAFCDFGNPSCMPGSTFTLIDNITGQTALRDNITAVMVNGTAYQSMRYSGSALKFDAGTVRIPWGVAKKKTFKISYRVHVTGHLNGASPPPTPVFFSNIDLWGTATVEFSRQDASFPAIKYSITKITYNFPAPGS
jgi:hypothetical protein